MALLGGHKEMSIYNLSIMTAATDKSIGNMVCLANNMVDSFPAHGLLILTFAITLTVVLVKGKTIYTAMPVSFFITSMISTIFVAMRCNGEGMVAVWLVFTLWGATAVATAIRVAVNRD